MHRLSVPEFAQKALKIFPKGYIDQEQINYALHYKGEFNIIDPESGLKIDFFITKDNEFEKKCFRRVVKKDYDYGINFISPEDLIISKLLWFRQSQSTRQLEDIISVMDIQTELDYQYLTNWIERLCIREEWQALDRLRKESSF